MTSRTPRILVAALTLVGLTLAPIAVAHDAAEPHDLREQDIDVTFTIERAGWAELNFEAEEGEEVHWSVTTAGDTPLYVDVHAHAGDVVLYHNETNVTATTQTFVVPSHGTYSILMQRDANPPAEVTLTAEGRFSVVSAQGFELPVDQESPGLTFAAGLVGLTILALGVRRLDR